MVKCQGLNEDGGPCGVDLLPNAKFCPECGTRVHKVTILEKPKDTVPCPGTDDGNPCSNKVLVQGQKFCFSCGWRVNQSIFEPGSRVCEADRQGTRCTGVIRKHETTCPICTSDKGAAPTAVQKDCVSDSKTVDQTESPADSKPVDQRESPADSKPVDQTQSPANSKPVDQTQSPADSKPVDHTQSPADSKPVYHTQSPADSKHVDQTQSPADSKPVDQTESLADSKPVDQTQFLNQHKETLTDQHSQNSESLFTDPVSQSTTRTGTTGKPSIEKPSANDKSGTPFLWSVAYRDGSLSQAKSPDQSETRDQAVQKPALWSVQGKQIPQHSAGQDPQTSDTKLKLLFSEEGEAGGFSRENENESQHGDMYEGITEPPNQGDNAGSTVKNQLAPEVQGGTSDQTSQTSGAKLNILYGDKNGKAVPEVQSDKNNDCYDPKQMSNKFQSSIDILQKNKKSSEDQYGEPEKRKGNDYHHGDTWEPPTFSLLGHKVQTESEPSPKGDDAASVVKPKPQSDLNEAGVTGSGDGPTQKPVSEEDDQGESVTATIPSGPILQHPPEDNSGADTGSSQKGIFNVTGSSRQKNNADVWQDSSTKSAEECKSGEIRDEQLFGDNSFHAETSKKLKTMGEALKESSLFSIEKEASHTSIESSLDKDKHQQNQDAASVSSKSDEESESSNNEEVGQNSDPKRRQKNRKSKTDRRKKMERKKKKEEEKRNKGKSNTDSGKETHTQAPDSSQDGNRQGPEVGKKKDTGANDKNKSTEPVTPDKTTKTDTNSTSTSSGAVQSNNDKRPDTKEQSRTYSNHVKVVFHAVFTPSILSDCTGGPYLCLVLPNVPYFKMETVSKFSDGSMELLAAVNINKHHLDNGISYSYCVDAGNMQLTSELFYDFYSYNYARRYLRVPRNSQQEGTWHQFDGAVYGKLESSFYKKLKNLFGMNDHTKNMKKDAESLLQYYFKHFQTELEKQILTPEEFIDLMRDLLRGFNYVYQFKGKLWDSSSAFEQFSGKIFQQLSMSFMRRITEDKLNIPEHLRFAIIITLVHAIMTFAPFTEKDEKDMELVCSKLKIPSMDRDIMTNFLQEVKALFPKYLDHVTKSLQLMNNCLADKTKNTCWLLVVPLLHFLWGRSSPYQLPSTETEHSARVPVWWGVEEYKGKNDYFAAKSTWNLGLNELLLKLKPWFDVDYLLPRTLMTVVKLEDMLDAVKSGLFSPDLCVAKLYFFLKARNLKLNHNDLRSMMDAISAQVLRIADKVSTLDTDDDRQQIMCDMYRLYTIGNDLLQLSIERRSLPTSVCVSIVVLQGLAVFEEAKGDKKEHQTRKSSKKVGKDYLVVLYNIRDELIRYLHNQCSIYDKHTCHNTLRIWNQLLDAAIPFKTIQEAFKGKVAEKVEKILKEKRSGYVLEVYVEHLDDFGNHIQEILSKIAFEALMNGVVDIGYSYQSMQHGKNRYAILLSDVFEKHWKQMTEEQMFHEALKWTPFVHFMDMFYFTEQSKHLSEESSMQLTQATTAIQDRMKQLESGMILVKDFSVICANFEKFDTLVKMSARKNEQQLEPTYIQQILNLRNKELQLFKETYGLVTVLIDMCSRFSVDIDTLGNQLTTLKNLESMPMSKLCRPGILANEMHPDEYQPVVTAFELSPEELDLLPQMKHCFNSIVFTKKWDSTGNRFVRQREEMLSVSQTFEHVWQPTIDWWNSITTKLKEGSMTFQEFCKLFVNMDITTIEREFSLIDKDGPWIKERMDQIQLFRDLAKCVEGAKIILQVVNKYELKGDFTPIKLITSVMSGRDIAMNTLDKSLEQTCSVLKGVDDRHVVCLKEFINCDPLILWLKESMPSGLKELKVFVDLASISAGEGDIEIAKVRCLHSATTGYAPLIFNLTDDIGYKDFLQKCKMVWNELEADPNLPKKLRDTNRQIEWLKTVKKAHGSVEVTSLAQTEAINSVGIYQVGRLPDQEWEQKPELKDVISLHVSEDEFGARQRKVYHYDMLHDLQSRLMLVAGKAEKGKEDVDRFTLILDSVVRLANTYIKLVASGCVLFSEWKAKFLCDRSRKACSFITFGMGDQLNTLKGRKATEDDDVSSIVPRIAKFMEKCYEEWLKYIAEKRDKYYELNYLTIDQMVILQRELVKVGTDKEPSKLIFPLLSVIKKECGMSDLISAMKDAQREVENMDELRVEEKETFSEEEVEEGEEEEVFIREVMKTGYSEELAKKALRHFKADEIDDAVVWCMDHEDDDDTDETMDTLVDMAEGGKEPPMEEYRGWTDTPMSISTVTSELLATLDHINKEVQVDPLIKDLEKLWERFLTSISSSVSDYLSVEHLGLVLRYLAAKETCTIKRFLIQSFKEGEPNLIICPQNDILNTVLTIFMNDRHQPLPQPDEVLICSSHTTLDQLDIFWRRAVFNQSGKIYCLANSDLLDYEVSDKGEQCLVRHMQTAKEMDMKYKLVVLCSTENEYKSRIVAALEKFRRPQLPVANQQLIRSYLKEKLKVDKADVKTNPASLVDFGGSTVRVVKSWRAGVGKSLYKTRRAQDLKDVFPTNKRTTGAVVSIPLHEKEINVDTIMDRLLECTLPAGKSEPRIFHIDISYEVYIGVDAFLFQLLVLGCLANSAGYVWIKSPSDHYLVEAMPLLTTDHSKQRGEQICFHRCFDILPDVTCRSPEESCIILQGRKPVDYADSDVLFDQQEFESPVFQRPYQYLRRLDERRGLADVNPYELGGDQINCLQTFLRHCGVRDPSWAELKHFVCFLNSQLQDFEVSAFCGAAAKEDLPGFDKFVLKFLIQMSRDFATRSLVMSEESPIQRMQRMALVDEETGGDGEENVIKQFQMRRTWESSPHPYLFFNPDHHSMTFVGFKIQRTTGDMLDQQTGVVLERHIMQRELQDSLIRNKVNIDENFDGLPRHEKILKLCSVMGMEMPHDPDDTYELTTDNVKKILAIYMRFKCDIPVIIMGETGCGKTRLVKFMCALQCPPGVNITNMILMKVHGGTKTKDIIKKVQEAENMARENADKYGQHIQTVLFFDEANTTEAIGLIKEIMCDRTIGGNQLKLCRSLKIIAACNPYRKHSEELIKRLEQAGLGYHVDAEKTTDTLGRVPLRRLVYRVQPLPQSLLPLVWDFGQLDTRIEELYIRQMVLRYIRADKLPLIDNLENVVSVILTASQDFMRKQKDECSFVSLRDVERVLEVMSWFYNQSQKDSALFDILCESSEENSDEDELEDDVQNQSQDMSDISRSLVLALGVCYHACLKKREEYRNAVATHFTPPCQIPGADPAQRMLEEIERCQDAFLNNIELGKNIAHNQALKENVFMMVTCIELRIPLFLVGKPGSSKSLAKTVVGNAMQGHAAHTDLFRGYKEVQMMSYQCSPLSTPDGISGMFRQCAQFQRDKDLNRFVSVVVLDEVGLAEDSPRMPLKTLHPLLEDGCEGDEKPEPFKKVAFIGISNWALDPAKMNRGILVQREVPELDELKLSAKGICQTDTTVYRLIKPLIPQMAKAYLELFESALKMREFFGLRDFYSLLKMVYAFADQKKRKPTWHQMQHAIMRNFGGMDDIDPVSVFERVLTTVNITERRNNSDPDCSPAGLIQACLTGDTTDSESRYLLLLTENYGALTILQQEILKRQKAITIFGSSFPSDQEYTQVCRNINRIKVCMETGNTVVLLNLENLYESLYDALNQYYVEFGGERYVDLGLGTHRVKCRVHKDFRLIVVAEKRIVYNKFPIPLINRLEKHFLNVSTMLTEEQLELAKRLEKWAKHFVSCHGNTASHFNNRMKKEEFSVGDVFMGYHADSCAAIVLHVYQQHYGEGQVDHEQVYGSAKRLLLWCATPDAVMRLPTTAIAPEEAVLNEIYWQKQQHQCLSDYLYQKIRQEGSDGHFAQVTTHSKLITSVDLEELSWKLGIPVDNMVLLNLQSFDTEQQFCRQVRMCFGREEDEMLLIVQSDCGDQNASLVACARYCIQDELQQLGYQIKAHIHAIFIIQLPRIAGGCFSGFQCGHWHSLHIDDLRPEGDTLRMSEMRGKSIGMLVHHAVGEESSQSTEITMETETPGEKDHQQTDMDVDEEDIRLDFDNMGGIPSNPAQSHKLPVENLVLSCIQAALAMVKDTKMDTARSTERVRQLLDLVLHYGQTNLVSHNLVKGICKHLDVLLMEKEKALVNPGNWLATEAAKAEVINTAGTFRRAWTQCMETKVTPILTGIIAFMDTNRNLESLYNAKDGDWVQQLWLGVINCTTATGLQYSQLVSPGHAHQELPEVEVRHTGTDGHLFTAQMPFSWLYFRLIEDLLNIANKDEADSLELVNKVRNILASRRIGVLLEPIIERDRQSVLKAYISDFVHMIYQVSSLQEHQLVCENVHIGSKAILQNQTGDGVAMMVAIHLAYGQNISRLRNFSSLNRVWPECSETIIDFQESSPNFFLCSDQEMTLDVVGLRLLLEKLEPEKETLNRAPSRAEWLQRVRHYRPVVERLLDMVRPGQDPEMVQCGVRCVKGIQEARLTWTSVLVVKLFIEHVYSIQGPDDKFTINRCMPLWTMMKTGADMKSLDSLKKVEKFLKMCNKLAVEHYFNISKDDKCENCENELEGPPVYLPCKDKVCSRCYHDIIIIKEFTCPVCQQAIPSDLRPNEDIHKSEKRKKYFNYKTRINSFFMEVVSQLCFADDTPPSDEVVQKLLSYITRSTDKGKVVTKKMSIFDDSIDATPVLRSFLLQLLLRTSGDQVSIYLETYLQQAAQFVDTTGKDHDQLIELCLLILQCVEDFYHQDVSKSEIPEKKEVHMATHFLRNSQNSIQAEELSVVKLYTLAETRFALCVVAKYVQKIFVDKSLRMTKGVRQMIDAAAKLCEECGSDWPCIFFIKQLCRCYGLDSYQSVCKSGDAHMCRWLQMLDLNRDEVLECSDLYVVCGEQYITWREMITKCLLGQDPDNLIQQLEGLREREWKKRVTLLLALYREVTMSFVYPEDRRRTQPEMYEQLLEALSSHQLFKAQGNLLTALFRNTIWRRIHRLNIHPGMELRDQSIVSLLAHTGITFLQVPEDNTLLQPLITLALLPQNMANCFLPTMPQDDMTEVKEALLAARDLHGNENPVVYRCPNGHPYIIGNCGRPATLGQCKDCGADIGGQGYVLSAGNIQDDGTDKTKPGHILGRADQRTDVVAAERKMSRITCVILRLLTHVAMLLGTNENPQVICSMIKPNIQDNTVVEFLLNHIKLDIASLHRVTGRSVDEVLLLIHKILASVTQTYANGGPQSAELCNLVNKEARNKWEEKFSKFCLEPLLQDMEKTIKSCNEQLTQDQRLGSDPLLCLLFEIDTPQHQSSAVALQEVASVWRFRSRISMDHLTTVFQTKIGREHQILKLFLEEDCHLRALRLVPSILRLQRMLIHKYQRKLDRAEATAFTVENAQNDFIEDGKEEEVKQLIKDFAEAWNCVRQALETFPCPTSAGIAVVSKEFCSKEITDSTPISMLLPTKKDAGLCSYVLVYFLLKKQRSFLEKYCKAKRQKVADLPKVRVQDLSPAHLISYHPDRDILPIVLANCNYSFEVGKGTKIEYDFGNIERQLGDRFLFAKSYIDIDEIEVMTYRSDVTNAVVFKHLREKIPQIQLGSAVRHQICQELRSLPDICDCLDKLDITISFLKSVGEDPVLSLDTFMSQTLKLTHPLVSPKSRAVCQCQHVQCLWLTLAQEKTKCLAKHRKDVFDSLGDEFRKELSEQQRDNLQYFCDGVQTDKLDHLMEVLFECIMLMIAIPQNQDDEDYIDILGQSLRQNLEGYLYSPMYDEDPQLPEWMTEAIARLDGENGEKLLVSQCVSVWLLLFHAHSRKERERSY